MPKLFIFPVNNFYYKTHNSLHPPPPSSVWKVWTSLGNPLPPHRPSLVFVPGRDLASQPIIISILSALNEILLQISAKYRINGNSWLANLIFFYFFFLFPLGRSPKSRLAAINECTGDRGPREMSYADLLCSGPGDFNIYSGLSQLTIHPNKNNNNSSTKAEELITLVKYFCNLNSCKTRDWSVLIKDSD